MLIGNTPSIAHSADCGFETRCECGQLLSGIREEGLELKCKHCNAIVAIPFTSMKG